MGGWEERGGGHTFQMHLPSHQFPSGSNLVAGTVRACFATWINTSVDLSIKWTDCKVDPIDAADAIVTSIV